MSAGLRQSRGEPAAAQRTLSNASVCGLAGATLLTMDSADGFWGAACRQRTPA